MLDPINIAGYGYVVLRVDDRFEAGQESFDEAKDEIQAILARPKMEPKVREYLTKLRHKPFSRSRTATSIAAPRPVRIRGGTKPSDLKPETTTKEEVAAHRHRPKFLGVIPHGSVAPGTKETSGSAVPTESAAAAAHAGGPGGNRVYSRTSPRGGRSGRARNRLTQRQPPTEPGVVTKPRKILGVIPHGTEQATAKPPKPEKPKAPPQPIKQ